MNDKLRMSEALLNAGMSKNGGWSDKQIAVFGVTRFQNPGWRKQIVGREFPIPVIEKFLAMKDAHLLGEKLAKRPKEKRSNRRFKVPETDGKFEVAQGKPSAEIRAECPFDLPPDEVYDRVARRRLDKEVREVERLASLDDEFAFYTEGI